VVIPTRDRANLIPFAIRSVLNQTFSDFEIIVSDNFSSDDTAETARAFYDGRIKYFRSDRALSLGESWEFALSHATGEYVIFLSDDDAYAKVCLERLFGMIDAESADLVSCRQAAYFAAEAEDHGRVIEARSLQLDHFDRKLSVLSKADRVKHLFEVVRLEDPRGHDGSLGIPQLVNTACKLSLYKSVQERVPHIFPVVGSDVYSAGLLLNFTNKFCYLNEPLYLHAEWEGSATVDASTFFERFPSEREMKYAPIKGLFTFSNLGTNYVLWALSDLGEDFIGVPIKWQHYFISAFKEICYLQANGLETDELWGEFYTALQDQDEDVQRIVNGAVSKRILLKARATSLLKRTVLSGLVQRYRHRKARYLNGFEDIADCANRIDESFLARYAEK
jgi:glycosyltransferase involved in cell wall biosynthesis